MFLRHQSGNARRLQLRLSYNYYDYDSTSLLPGRLTALSTLHHSIVVHTHPWRVPLLSPLIPPVRHAIASSDSIHLGSGSSALPTPLPLPTQLFSDYSPSQSLRLTP